MQDMPPVVLEWVMAAAAVWNTLFVHPVMKESKIVSFASTDQPTIGPWATPCLNQIRLGNEDTQGNGVHNHLKEYSYVFGLLECLQLLS